MRLTRKMKEKRFSFPVFECFALDGEKSTRGRKPSSLSLSKWQAAKYANSAQHPPWHARKDPLNIPYTRVNTVHTARFTLERIRTAPKVQLKQLCYYTPRGDVFPDRAHAAFFPPTYWRGSLSRRLIESTNSIRRNRELEKQALCFSRVTHSRRRGNFAIFGIPLFSRSLMNYSGAERSLYCRR